MEWDALCRHAGWVSEKWDTYIPQLVLSSVSVRGRPVFFEELELAIFLPPGAKAGEKPPESLLRDPLSKKCLEEFKGRLSKQDGKTIFRITLKEVAQIYGGMRRFGANVIQKALLNVLSGEHERACKAISIRGEFSLDTVLYFNLKDIRSVLPEVRKYLENAQPGFVGNTERYILASCFIVWLFTKGRGDYYTGITLDGLKRFMSSATEVEKMAQSKKLGRG